MVDASTKLEELIFIMDAKGVFYYTDDNFNIVNPKITKDEFFEDLKKRIIKMKEKTSESKIYFNAIGVY